MMKQKKVLTIVESLAVGGAEMLVVNLLKGLDGYEKHLLVLNKPDTLLKDIPPECHVEFLHFRSYKDILKTVWYIRRYINKNQIDIVHAHMYWSNIISRLATPRKIKLFNCIQNISSLASYNVNKASLYLEKLTYRKRHHIIAVSQTVLDDFDSYIGIKGPASVLYNIIDDQFFAPALKRGIAKEQVRLVAVGNLRKQKNYPYLIEVFKHMPPKFSIDVYGLGNMEATLQEMIDKFELKITLCGLKENMQDELLKYDGFVMCSTHEGLSLALMEAMASGLPAFLSDIPVQRETAGEAAEYFNLADPSDAVNCIIRTFKNLERLTEMSAQGQERAEKMARKESYLYKLKQLYESEL